MMTCNIIKRDFWYIKNESIFTKIFDSNDLHEFTTVDFVGNDTIFFCDAVFDIKGCILSKKFFDKCLIFYERIDPLIYKSHTLFGKRYLYLIEALKQLIGVLDIVGNSVKENRTYFLFETSRIKLWCEVKHL